MDMQIILSCDINKGIEMINRIDTTDSCRIFNL